ncbi:MAG: oligosaccharide flippase family protein [Microscillaceae bacterium]|jgi:O-antigen/teichoic acid export membrane protein|nr:oligosaccharide flippase family protein [Microscillaceae bacterium]
MGIIIRQSLKASLANLIGAVLGAFNILWLFPQFLTKAEIGIIALLEGLAISSMTLGSLGVFNMTDRFFPRFKTDDRQHHGYLFFLCTYLGVGFGLTIAILLIFKDLWLSFYLQKAPEIAYFFYYLLPFVFVMMYQALFEAYARVHLRIALPNLIREVGIKLLIALSVLLYAAHLIGFEQLVAWRVASYGVAMGLMFFYLRRLKVWHFEPNFEFLNGQLLREMMWFGLFIVVSGIGNLLIIKLDVLMIPAFLGKEALGVYTLAFFIGTVIEIPRRAIAQISIPLISQAWADNDLPKIQSIYTQSALNQLIIGLFLFLGIWSNIDELFAFIPNGKQYTEGKYVIFFIGLTRLVDMATGVNNEILLQSKYYLFNLYTVILLGLTSLLTNWLLIPAMGITGAALATLIAFFLYNLARFWFLWYRFNLQPFGGKNLIISLLALVCYGLVLVLPLSGYLLVNVIIKSLAITLSFGGLIYYFKFSPELNAVIHNLLLRLGLRKVRN